MAVVVHKSVVRVQFSTHLLVYAAGVWARRVIVTFTGAFSVVGLGVGIERLRRASGSPIGIGIGLGS